MTKNELTKIIRDTGRPMGYSFKASLCWRKRAELATLVQPQASQWDACLYVNVGVVPSSFLDIRIPPNSGYWGYMERASAIKAPFAKHFDRLEERNDSTVKSTDIVDAVRHLFEWVDENLADERKVRNALKEPSSPISEGATLMLRDWVKGMLKEPSEYNYLA